MRIVGVSFDEIEKNAEWAADEGFTFELWTDSEDNTLAQYFGAADGPNQTWANRKTVLLDDEGSLLLDYPSVDVGTHPGQVLSDCQALFGS